MKKTPTLQSLILQQNVIYILAITFIVVAIWVGFSIYFSYSKSTITSTDMSLIAPLTPTIDTHVFDVISQRKTWSDQQLQNFPISTKTPIQSQTSTQATPRPISTPIASTSAQLTTPKNATASAKTGP